MPALATHATDAFTHSLQSGGLLFAVAAVVFFLTPKGTEVSNAKH
ncbi:hypothetical protein ACGF8B_26835 [Streptomyces sp. NPDC047917]